MTFGTTKLATFASALVLAFPILLLCVPRGSGIFLAAVVVLATDLVLATMILFLNGTRGATLAMLLTALPLLFVRYRGLSAARFFAAIALFAALGVGAYLIPGGPVAEN